MKLDIFFIYSYLLLKGCVYMKQIVPFKKELPFKTKVSDITSISLERDIKVTDEGVVTGTFYITGDYKMNEGSINREKFSFDLPFDITLDPRYDISTVNTDIEDFYYDIKNEDTLKVNIDLFIEADYLPEPIEDKKEEEQEAEEVIEDNKDEELVDVIELNDRSTTIDKVDTDRTNVIDNNKIEEDSDSSSIEQDLFSNLDNTETYTTYYVYIVKEEDTIDKIITRYSITKEDLEYYNDIADIKVGDKIIIPKTRE